MKPRRFVMMFNGQFAERIGSGLKTQAIRPIAKRTPVPGDTLSLRTWSGKPYRSKHTVLRDVVVTSIHKITISEWAILLDGDPLPHKMQCDLAGSDGFCSPIAMTRWFSEQYGLPFYGMLIKWRDA